MMKKIGLIVASVAAVGVIFVGANTFACGDEAKHKTASTTVEGKSCCPQGSANSKAMAGNSSCGSSAVQTASDGKNAGHSCGSKATMTAGQGCGAKSGQTAAGGKTSGHSCGTKSSMTAGAGCDMKSASAGHGSCASKHGKTATSSGDMTSCGAHATKAAYAANVFEIRDGHKYAVAQGKKFEVTSDTPYYEVGSARYYFADSESMSRCAEKMASLAAELDKEAVSLATAEGNTVTEQGQKYGVCPVSNDKFLVTADSRAKVMDGQKYYVCSEKCASVQAQPAVLSEPQMTH